METQAHIYLTTQRGYTVMPLATRLHTFNYGNYTAEAREPFGRLEVFNDEFVQAGGSLSEQVKQNTIAILLPVTGGLEYEVGAANDFLEPGQAGVISIPAYTSYTLKNLYENETIRFLHIQLAGTAGTTATVEHQPFNLSQTDNLQLFFTSGYTQGYIGRFQGRQEGQCLIEDTGRVFVFVLSGVFEIANRLLHEADGLTLCYEKADILEFEALSNDAIILLIKGI